jgi:hypothetical protein
MDIIEIPELPPQIKHAAELGELVIFIGAGMSYELGYSCPPPYKPDQI